MSRLIALALVCAATSGCASQTVYEAALGRNITQNMPWSKGQDGGFRGGTDTVRFTVRQESPSKRTFVSYSHVSHLSTGAPFSSKPEDWLDVVEVGVRFSGSDF